MVPLRIKGFYLDQDRMPVAVLSDCTGARLLPVWIGPSEACAIITELEHVPGFHPAAHDVLVRYFQRHGFVMDSLEIYADPAADASADAHGCGARIHYHRRWRRYRMEVRPSDGLALAVRLKAPILAAPGLLGGADFRSLLAFLHDPSRGLPLSWTPEAGAPEDPEEGPARGQRQRTMPLN